MIEEVKDYAKVEDQEESSQIESLTIAAKNFLKNAGINITAEMESNELYKLAIKILVTHWNENREVIGKADKLAYSLDSIIGQLKYCEV